MSLRELLGHLGLPDAQALAGRHHQRDGHDAPGDAEHGERRAQLVRGERAQRVAQQVAEGHLVGLLQDDLVALPSDASAEIRPPP